ncbi:MAG: alpha/beta hydrolase, partial [bacterium]|nr:alpha/beta hydrolase [bacterium]
MSEGTIPDVQPRPDLTLLGRGAPAPTGRNVRDVAALRATLYRLMGQLPDRHRLISVEHVAEDERNGYILETLALDLNGFEPVPAYFVRPKNPDSPSPVVLYNHAHGGRYDIGKEELLSGRGALQDPPYADVLTELGWCALCIDTWAFGKRAHTSEQDLFKAMLWQGRVMWGMMVYDSLRALDYLETRSEIDPKRIATLGISMGSTMAWWVAALDERVKVTVDICCQTDFH